MPVMLDIGNAVLKPLLRSPLHFVASHGLMLITVTGRKTGRLYTTPVAYGRQGDSIYFFSGKDRKWIRNLAGGAPVTLRLRGKDVPARAELCPEDETSRELLKAMYPRMSADKAADMLMIRVQI